MFFYEIQFWYSNSKIVDFFMNNEKKTKNKK